MFHSFFENWISSLAIFALGWIAVSFLFAIRLGQFFNSVELKANLLLKFSLPVTFLRREESDSEVSQTGNDTRNSQD